MIKNNKKWMVLSLLLVMLLAALAGCVRAGSQSTPEVIYPTVVIVQYVTQVVATNTPEPPATPLPPCKIVAPADTTSGSYLIRNSNGTFDPFAVPIHYPLRGCPIASRLTEGNRAFVAYTGDTQAIHFTTDIGYSPIVRELSVGEVLEIVGGPECDRGALIWKVITQDGLTGYAAEGDGNQYWLLPYGEKNDRARTRPTPEPVFLVNPNKTYSECIP
jgi:hypothetical protein